MLLAGWDESRGLQLYKTEPSGRVQLGDTRDLDVLNMCTPTFVRQLVFRVAIDASHTS